MSDSLSWLNPMNWFGGGSSGSSPAVVNPDGTTSVGGWTFAPGYGAPDAGPSNPSQPYAPTDWSKIGDALKGLEPKTPATDSSLSKIPASQAGTAQSTVGRPSAPVSLDNLVRLLQQRQQMYMQSATGGQGKGSPVAQGPTTSGLLGY